MQMKVFNKGQIVIPADVRRLLGIEIGDKLEVEVDRERRLIELHKPARNQSSKLAGAFAEFARGKTFPSRKQMSNALSEGLLK